jgi:hypothetical protein
MEQPEAEEQAQAEQYVEVQAQTESCVEAQTQAEPRAETKVQEVDWRALYEEEREKNKKLNDDLVALKAKFDELSDAHGVVCEYMPLKLTTASSTPQ